MSGVLQQFVRTFFDENPLSQVGFCVAALAARGRVWLCSVLLVAHSMLCVAVAVQRGIGCLHTACRAWLCSV